MRLFKIQKIASAILFFMLYVLAIFAQTNKPKDSNTSNATTRKKVEVTLNITQINLFDDKDGVEGTDWGEIYFNVSAGKIPVGTTTYECVLNPQTITQTVPGSPTPVTVSTCGYRNPESGFYTWKDEWGALKGNSVPSVNAFNKGLYRVELYDDEEFWFSMKGYESDEKEIGGIQDLGLIKVSLGRPKDWNNGKMSILDTKGERGGTGKSSNSSFGILQLDVSTRAL